MKRLSSEAGLQDRRAKLKLKLIPVGESTEAGLANSPTLSEVVALHPEWDTPVSSPQNQEWDTPISSPVNSPIASPQNIELVSEAFDNAEERSDDVRFDWKLLQESKRSSKKFLLDRFLKTFEIKHNLKKFNNLFDLEDAIDDMYEKMMHEELKKFDPDDLYSCYIRNNDLNSDIFIPYRKIKNFDKQDFLNNIFEVAQSNKAFLLDGKLEVELSITKTMKGNGKVKPPRTIKDFRKKELSTVIINTEKNCFWKALVLCIAKYNKEPKEIWLRLLRDSHLELTYRAKEMCDYLQGKWNHPVTLDMIKEYQDKLSPHWSLNIIDQGNRHNRLFGGILTGKNVFLEYDTIFHHFNCITTITGYLKKSYYCIKCHQGFKDITDHKCDYTCEKCFNRPKCQVYNEVYCENCNRVLNNEICNNNHKKIVCKNVKVCKICKIQHKAGENHTCEEIKCHKCQKCYKGEHYCFLKPIENKQENSKILVFYDIESTQEDQFDMIHHRPMLLISSTICDECKGNIKCPLCENLIQEFWGYKCVKEFGDYLYQQLAPKAAIFGSTVYVIAHNSRGYDGHFLFTDIWERQFKDVKIVMNGRKIVSLSVGNVKFLDSLAFLMQPLAKLPKMFGFNNDVKGFFPHQFNKCENWNYIGPYPEKKYYSPEYMKKQLLDEFNNWYHTVKNNIFDFKKEILLYCKNDVMILRKAFMEYRFLFNELVGFDPISSCYTTATVALKTFRCNYLPEDTIGITPNQPYGPQSKYSVISQCWLDFVEKEKEIKIQREYKIGPYWVDGYDEKNNTIYEFFGCFYHNCPCQETPDTEMRYSKTMDRLDYYKERKFNIAHIWECELNNINDKKLKKYLKKRKKQYNNIRKYGKLTTRDALFGGRTNNSAFYFEADSIHSIKYYDFTSLYPYVLKKYKYPIGHPTIITEDFLSLEEYFGFVKCKIQPPKKLHFPVLPVKTHSKLLFPLCLKCCEEQKNQLCNHNDEERQFVGTWSIIEVLKALEKGYIIIEIYIVQHYPNTSDKLFKGYIEKFLKIKQESSGWPSNCMSEDNKEKYINDYFTNEGIQLDYTKIERNPGMRNISKLMLNSLWGKFAQRSNLTKTEIIHDYETFHEIITDETNEVKGDYLVNDDTMIVSYKKKKDEDCSPGNTSVAIAAFVTSYARLELYNEIDKISQDGASRVLYYDTDSIIFTWKDGQYKPRLGNFLGQMTDEISEYGNDAYITRFVSFGPKTYALEIKTKDDYQWSFKLKGISLNSKVNESLSFDGMLQSAKDYVCKTPTVNIGLPQFQIKTSSHHLVLSNYLDKAFKPTSNKRIYFPDGSTLPLGYTKFAW